MLCTAMLHEEQESGVLDQQNPSSVDAYPCSITFTSLLRQYGNASTPERAREVHFQIVVYGLEKQRVLERLLLQAYGRTGSPVDASAVFTQMNDPDPISWNFVIRSCVKHEQNEKAFQLFENMLLECCLPDKFVFASILGACYGTSGGKSIHARIFRSGFEYDVVLATALVNMYGKNGNMENAWSTFQNIEERDVAAWNAMISVHTQHGLNKDSIFLYEMMLSEGIIPNEVTYACVLSACASDVLLMKGNSIHTQIMAVGLKVNMHMKTSLIYMYGKCGRTEHARHLFDAVSKEDVIVWNAMITVYAQNGQGDNALEIFGLMKAMQVKPTVTTFVSILEACMIHGVLLDGKRIHSFIKQCGYESDVMVGTSLLNMYGKLGDLKEAAKVFDKLTNRTVVSWNTFLASYAERECGVESLQLFQQMLCEGFIPDKPTLHSIIPVCARNASALECKHIHSFVVNNVLDYEESLGTSIINMYGRSGKLEDAQSVFDVLSKSSVSSWTALISAYDEFGDHVGSISLFYQMLLEGILPDKIAFISLLTAFANKGMLAEGMLMHARIAGTESDFEIDVQNALIAMYGKFSRLENALSVFFHMLERNVISWNEMITTFFQHERIDETFQLFYQMLHEGMMLDKATMMSMLNLCGSYGTISEGTRLHTYILEIQGGNEMDDAISDALISMYTCCGSLQDARRVYENLKSKGILPLTSMIESCSFHGDGETVIMLFNQMQESGLPMQKVTLTRVFSACSHLGLVSEAHHLLSVSNKDPRIFLSLDHFNCIVDLIGRTGRSDAAEKLVHTMPFLPNVSTWSMLVSASRICCNIDQGALVAKFVFELEPDNTATYVTLSNMYALAAITNC